jgi:hypothetical protein
MKRPNMQRRTSFAEPATPPIGSASKPPLDTLYDLPFGTAQTARTIRCQSKKQEVPIKMVDHEEIRAHCTVDIGRSSGARRLGSDVYDIAECSRDGRYHVTGDS